MEHWQPSIHQLVNTSAGAGVIVDISMVTASDHEGSYLRFKVRLIEGALKGVERKFGTAEISPMLIRISLPNCVYDR